MGSEQVTLKSVCQYCGRVGHIVKTFNVSTFRQTPTVPGKCPSSPTGVHAPKWERG